MDKLTDPKYIPELWSTSFVDVYTKAAFNAFRPKRSAGTQLLRDAALGHPEYPKQDMTHEDYAGFTMARSIDSDILDSLRYQTHASTTVKK